MDPFIQEIEVQRKAPSHAVKRLEGQITQTVKYKPDFPSRVGSSQPPSKAVPIKLDKFDIPFKRRNLSIVQPSTLLP